MKKRYFLQAATGFFIALILFTTGRLTAQNRNYLDYDGSNDYVRYANDATLEGMNGKSNYTLEAWVFVASDADNFATILRRNNQFTIYYRKTYNSIGLGIYSGQWYYYHTLDNTITTNEWHHIAVIRNNTLTHYLHIYIDGVDQIDGTWNGYVLTSNNTEDLFVARVQNGDYPLKGYIDEVRLKNVAEDPSDLHYHSYDNQYTSDANTTALFHFNEGTGTSTLNEASGNNATLYNGVIWRDWDYKTTDHLPLAHEWTGASSTDWGTSGNWTGDVPASANDVLIPSGLTNYPTVGEATDADCNNLYLESGATLTMQSNSSGDASLIVAGSVEGSGTFNIQRYVGAWSDASHGWHFISSPVSNQAISTEFVDISASPISSNVDFYRWSETENMWINIKDNSGDYNQGSASTNFSNDASPVFGVGDGYLIAYGSNQTKTFSGTVNNSDVSVTGLSKDNDGWHLLGNPYPSALYWNKASSEWNLSNISTTAKIWKESTASYSDISSGTGIIPAMQGFMVQATAAGASLTIPLSDRTHSTTAWYKSAETNKIKLTVHDTEGNTAQESIVRILTGSTAGFDTQYDAHFLAGYAPMFYSVTDNKQLSTNTIPDVSAVQTIPFEFIKNGSNTYYIEAEGVESLVPAVDVYLTDLKTNYTQKLNDNPVYYFTAQEGDAPQRFQLRFGTLGIDEVNNLKPFNIYGSKNRITVRSGKMTDAEIYVYNAAGQLITKSHMINETVKNIHLNNYSGMAIVSVVSSQGTQNTKLIIR